MEPYSSIKNNNNKLLILASTWMDLRAIMLNKRSQSLKVMQCKIPFFLTVSRNAKVVMQNRSVVARDPVKKDKTKKW